MAARTSPHPRKISLSENPTVGFVLATQSGTGSRKQTLQKCVATGLFQQAFDVHDGHHECPGAKASLGHIGIRMTIAQLRSTYGIGKDQPIYCFVFNNLIMMKNHHAVKCSFRLGWSTCEKPNRALPDANINKWIKKVPFGKDDPTEHQEPDVVHETSSNTCEQSEQPKCQDSESLSATRKDSEHTTVSSTPVSGAADCDRDQPDVDNAQTHTQTHGWIVFIDYVIAFSTLYNMMVMMF